MWFYQTYCLLESIPLKHVTLKDVSREFIWQVCIHVYMCALLMCIDVYITASVHHCLLSFQCNLSLLISYILLLFSSPYPFPLDGRTWAKVLVQSIIDRFTYLSNSHQKNLNHRNVSMCMKMLCKASCVTEDCLSPEFYTK